MDFFEMIEYDLLEVGNDCVFGSRVKLYASDDTEAIPIVLSDNANVLDRSVLMPGVKVGKEAICGTYTIGPKNHEFADFSISTGSRKGEPILLRKRLSGIEGNNSGLSECERQMVLLARSRHKSTLCWLLFNAWVVLSAIIWKPMRSFFYLGVIVFWHCTPMPIYWLIVLTPLAIFICDFLHVCLVLAVKRIVVGRYRKGNYPYYGVLHYKWTLMMAVHSSLDDLLTLIEGTFLMNLFHRAMGTSVARNVCILGRSSYESDLMMIEDEVTFDRRSLISCHTVENMVLKLAPVYYQKGVSCRANSVLMPGCTMEQNSTLLEESQVLKGETVPAGQTWGGLPAEPINDEPLTNSESIIDMNGKLNSKLNLADKKII